MCMYESHVIVTWPVTCMTLCMFSRWVLAPVTRSSSGSMKPNHNWWDTSLSTQWTPNLSWHYYGNDITVHYHGNNVTVHYHGNNVWDNTWATLQDLATRSTSADRNTESRKLSPYVVCSHGLKPGMEETSYTVPPRMECEQQRDRWWSGNEVSSTTSTISILEAFKEHTWW